MSLKYFNRSFVLTSIVLYNTSFEPVNTYTLFHKQTLKAWLLYSNYYDLLKVKMINVISLLIRNYLIKIMAYYNNNESVRFRPVSFVWVQIRARHFYLSPVTLFCMLSYYPLIHSLLHMERGASYVKGERLAALKHLIYYVCAIELFT